LLTPDDARPTLGSLALNLARRPEGFVLAPSSVISWLIFNHFNTPFFGRWGKDECRQLRKRPKPLFTGDRPQFNRGSFPSFWISSFLKQPSSAHVGGANR
jgi:hypothetical protein